MLRNYSWQWFIEEQTTLSVKKINTADCYGDGGWLCARESGAKS